MRTLDLYHVCCVRPLTWSGFRTCAFYWQVPPNFIPLSISIFQEHFTNEHMAIHLYGCHLCNQASTYPDFLMHSCFEGKEEFITGEPKFSHCFALLLCA